MPSYMLVNHYRKFIVCTNALCGSTSIREWFKYSLPEPDLYRGETVAKDFGLAIDEIERFDGYHKLFFIRDPLRRLVSFYCNWVVKDTNREEWCFADDRKTISLVGTTFRQFLYALRDLRRDRYQHHLLPQSAGVRDVRFDRVLDIENFDSHIVQLNKLLGTHHAPRRRHRTNYDYAYEDDVFDLHPDDFGGRFPGYRYFYDEELAELARGLYTEDLSYYRRHTDRVRAGCRPEAHEDAGISVHFLSRPRPSPGARVQTGNGTLKLSHSHTGRRFALNEQASAVWALCDGTNTPEDIRATLEEIYRCNRRKMIGDINTILHQLYEFGLVDLWDPGTALPTGIRRLDLTSIPILVINCPEDTGRKEFMQSQLAELGLDFEFVPGIKCDPRPVGIALSHLKALRRPGLKPPFLILEDDCEFNDTFKTTIEVPAGTDALYLGISHYGITTPGEFGWGVYHSVRYYHYGPEHLRVLNMLSRHAVLFLSERFHRNTIKASIAALTNRQYPYPGDIGYAMLHASHVVITPNDPHCRQSRALGGIQESTSRTIRKVPC